MELYFFNTKDSNLCHLKLIIVYGPRTANMNKYEYDEFEILCFYFICMQLVYNKSCILSISQGLPIKYEYRQ